MSIEQTASRIAALGAGGPVRVADALAAGVTRGALRAACHRGLLSRPLHGYVAPATGTRDDPAATFLSRCRALLSRRPHAVLSHATAAVLHGLPVSRHDARSLHCIDPNPRRTPGVITHRGDVSDDDIIGIDGLRLTSALHTAVDVARSSQLPQALMTMDAALRRRTLELTEHLRRPEHRRVEDPGAQARARAELHDIAARCAGRPGATLARQAARAASPLAESPAESWSRGHLLLAGIVPQGLQVRIVDAEGHERRLDFLLCDGLAGEVDGMVKYDGQDGARQLRGEKVRDLLLERVHVRTIRWTGVEVFRDPASVIDLVSHAISQERAVATRRFG